MDETRWLTMVGRARNVDPPADALDRDCRRNRHDANAGLGIYLPAILADPIAAGLDVPKSLFFGFFSGSLLLQAALGPMIGKAIDRHGGRGVLVLSNLVLGAGLVWLAFAQGPVGLAGAWAALGI